MCKRQRVFKHGQELTSARHFITPEHSTMCAALESTSKGGNAVKSNQNQHISAVAYDRLLCQQTLALVDAWRYRQA